MRKLLNDGYTGVAVTVLFFFVFLFPLTKPFPYSDDWSYLYYLVDLGSLDLSWLFSLHNDHRIPIQKIFHLTLLKLTGGDFRILIAANVITIAATSVCWIMLSRIVKKESSLSEWIVPGVLLGFGFNTVAWGFNFQFLSALFFLALANLLWVIAIRDNKNSFGGVFFTLALCALCGGNGLITSSIVGAGFLVAIMYTNGIRGLSWKTGASLVVWGGAIIAIWSGWSSSSATETLADGPEQYFLFGFEMLKSWLGVFAMQNGTLMTVFATIILLVSLGGSFVFMALTKTKQPRCLLRFMLLPVFLSALQASCMIIVIAYSRAGAQPWSPGLELHYGYLVTALPLSAWIVVLMLPKGWIRQIVLASFTLIIAITYISNAGWRIKAAQDEYRRGAAVVADILSPMSNADVAHRHIREFYWVDGEQAESSVSNGLSLLRKTTFWSQGNP